MSSAQVNAAMGPDFDVVGEELTRNGREDCSGARRAVMDRLRRADYITAGILLNCSATRALELANSLKCATGQ